ncbi:Glu/Leu/Phe/Val dehydrogenase dimerization domain-containing protein [Nitratireductor sp. XY-223]|uniref:Glu/Leu/Phe/Val dehydrogenase dimerization domain-containing protein n=1 Tax=Nitratireductor sp. XY-223 TaxID=2561926 RepID=UPI001FEDEBE7|nr:Glu/Leu/Phe/Val dehydrogenase dimerization domain-containing protein [Nitratireductor sp. XY-223]
MEITSKSKEAGSMNMSGFDHPEFDGHEKIVFGHDARTGLYTVIAIHDTRLGPALGGCRMWPYQNTEEALTDALRLSRGMTYKNAMAGLDYGGGKAVIIADPKKDKSPELMHAFGKKVDALGGLYITGEDVGMTPADMEAIGGATEHVRGTSKTHRGDPSPYTALGVYCGIQSALKHLYGSSDLHGRTVSVQGLGNVGFTLARFLHDAGADLVVSDINQSAVGRAVSAFGAKSVDTNDAHKVEADVFAPCAMGAGINSDTIPELGAPIIAGSANNQLAEPSDGEALAQRGILYAPDYVINAGGVIALARHDVEDDVLEADVRDIGDTLTEIFLRAQAENAPTATVADRIAEERLSAADRQGRS